MNPPILPKIKLSKNNIDTFVGDVFAIELEGEGIDENSLITWSADGEVARIRTFSGDQPSPKNAALVSIWEAGRGFVFAEYLGEKYEAKISAHATVTPEGELHYYRADLHAHTSNVHKAEQFALHETEDITDYLDAVTADGDLDLTVISDHAAVTNDRDFYRGFQCAEDLTAPVVLAGAENEITFTDRDRFGVTHRHGGEIVVVASAGYVSTDSWESFEAEMKYSALPIAIFAHPYIVGYSTPGMWNFDFKNRTSELMLNIIRGIEMGNGMPSGCNILHEYAISLALDAGFKLSTTCSSDCHGPGWGFGSCPGKTVVIAKDKSREMFHEALRACRFYATESGNVKLKYSVNGSCAPADLALTNSYKFKIELDLFDPDPSTMPTRCEVITDYGAVALKCNVVDRLTEFEIKSDTARYFYLRLIDACGRKTWSMPVWCGRAFDAKTELPHLTPIDMSDFTATADGAPAPALIDGDPYHSYESSSRIPKIVIDMKKRRRISAVGYYPHQVYRSKDKPSGWHVHDETPSLLSKYNIYLSDDGKSYSLVKQATCRLPGEENVERFVPREARYVMIEVTETVGMNSCCETFLDNCARIGNLTVFE